MLAKTLTFVMFGLTLIYADGQTSIAEGYLTISNGLWHLHKLGTDQDRNRKWDSDDEFRLCVGDGGEYVPFLIGKLSPTWNRDNDVRFRVTAKDSEYVEVKAKQDDLEMNLTFKSSVKASADGTETTSEGKWSVHMDLDYQGTDCQGIGPGHSRAKVFGEWR